MRGSRSRVGADGSRGFCRVGAGAAGAGAGSAGAGVGISIGCGAAAFGIISCADSGDEGAVGVDRAGTDGDGCSIGTDGNDVGAGADDACDGGGTSSMSSL